MRNYAGRLKFDLSFRREIPNWAPMFALLAVVGWGTWCLYSLLEGGSSDVVEFNTALTTFVVLALIYLFLRGVDNLGWTSVPVLLTLEALAGFIFVPAWRFLTGLETLDDSYVQAMNLVLIGFSAFWVASIALARERGARFSSTSSDTSPRTVLFGCAFLVLGILGNTILWRTGLYSYAADPGLRESAFGIIQWLNLLANLLDFSLLIAAIEIFSKRSSSNAIKVIFAISFIASLGFGVLSGMKVGPLHPIANVIIIYGIIRGRLPRAALVLPVLLVILVYPFVNALRGNLNSGYRAQFNTVEGLEQTLGQSFNDAFSGAQSTNVGTGKENLHAATSRLSYLTYVRDIASLPVPSMIAGEEKVWLAPIYPLIPRLLWPGKPVLNKGSRLSVALGRPATTSSALTPVGDLYAMYGIPGVILGMLFWGACLQLYMNWIGRKGLNESSLFIFMFLLTALIDFENDFVGLIAATVQRLAVALVLSYLIYGRPISKRTLRYAG